MATAMATGGGMTTAMAKATATAKAMGNVTAMAKRGRRSTLPCRVAASLSCGSSACGPPSSIRRRFVGGDRGCWEETPPLRPTRRERGR